ncbi:sensor histidine kinase [Cohnella lubricantis]|uniref:Histidine kinase n=1 Tax=Cohnella lubricantis TaxID=2163172 RepID=A0A841T8T9_9BACL|nr:sensor histidine kinase [Cohnella lubricantis]MBB6677923.1 histidine kinase [Cohnella lubricantis]MBP2120328.1 two-component system sensor histidine kinase YesM [Cohnella lubricantis]
MIRYWRRLSLARQILIFVLMMLAILLISFVITSRIAEKIIEKKVTESVNKILLQVEEKITGYYTDMEGSSMSLLYSQSIQNLLNSEDKLSVILLNSEVTSMFANTMSQKENIRGIRLYNSEGTLVASIGAIDVGVKPHIVESIEYSGLLSEGGVNPYYAISIPIYNLKSEKVQDYRGMCEFIMDVGNFNHILNKAKITSHSSFLLLDQNGKMMASEGKTTVEDSIDINEWNHDKRFIVQSVTLPRSGWQLISIIPRKELLNDLSTIQHLNIATYLVMIGMLSLFLLLFYTRIMTPIKALMDFIKAYPKSGGESRFPVVYRNEIGVLGSSLNKMLDEIDDLGKSVQLTQKRMYEFEIAKKHMEVLAFRNQINPHFLHNTLECIRAIALYNKVQEIAEISESLSNMFRYSVKGTDFVTIEDELAHVREYARIIEYRFMGRIRVEIEADRDLLGLKTLKMILQPIVENAVFHGLEKQNKNGLVQIKVYKPEPEMIQYIIKDNGYGIDQADLGILMQHLRQSEDIGNTDNKFRQGIGLGNICRRMKLFYGDEADMTVSSQLHKGTVVSISFPAIDNQEQMEGSAHV